MSTNQQQESGTKKRVVWLPLESNPDILNKIIHENGVSQEYSFTDVYGLDDDAVAWIPRPAAAFIFLFPGSKNYDEFRKKDDERLKTEKQEVSDKVVFFTQTIRNACGMMALIHCLANNQQLLGDGLFKRIMNETKDLSPQKRGEYMESCAELAAVHDTSAKAGQSETPELGEEAPNHFIAFVHVDDHIYEMDGGRPFPLNHGKTNDFVADTIKLIKDFVARDPNDNEFNLIALAKTD